MLNIHFAPVQGYTDYTYRSLHANTFGGVTTYTTPFLRLESNAVRNKDLNDILPANNHDVPVVPQLIASNSDELNRLADLIQQNGYTRIDINMGCSFPLQTRLMRGAGMLPHPDHVASLLEAMAARPEVTWSVKMRLGMEDPTECLALLPLLDKAPLHHITLHPRTGRAGFVGPCDEEAFAAFAARSSHPVWWCGDLLTLQDLAHIEATFPQMTDVMIGRGLLARPSLAAEYAEGAEWSEEKLRQYGMAMHDAMYDIMSKRLQGPAQLLARMQAFWEYQTEPWPKKYIKAIMKAKDIIRYKDAMDLMRKG